MNTFKMWFLSKKQIHAELICAMKNLEDAKRKEAEQSALMYQSFLGVVKQWDHLLTRIKSVESQVSSMNMSAIDQLRSELRNLELDYRNLYTTVHQDHGALKALIGQNKP